MADLPYPNPNGLPATSDQDNRSWAQSIVDYISDRTNVSGALRYLLQPNIANAIHHMMGTPTPDQIVNTRRGVAGKRGDPSAVTGPLSVMGDILLSVTPLRTGPVPAPVHRFRSMPGQVERNILGDRHFLGSGLGELNPRTAIRGVDTTSGNRGGLYPQPRDVEDLVNREFPDYYIHNAETARTGTRYLDVVPRQGEFRLPYTSRRRPSLTPEEQAYTIRFPNRFNRDPQNSEMHPAMGQFVTHRPSYYRDDRFLDTGNVQNPYLNSSIFRDSNGKPLYDRRNFVNELRRRLSGEGYNPVQNPINPPNRPQPDPNQLELGLKGPGGSERGMSPQIMQRQINELNQHHIEVTQGVSRLISFVRANPSHPDREQMLSTIDQGINRLRQIQDYLATMQRQHTLDMGQHRTHSIPTSPEMSILGDRFNVDRSSGWLNPSTRYTGSDTFYDRFLGRRVPNRLKGPDSEAPRPVNQNWFTRNFPDISPREAQTIHSIIEPSARNSGGTLTQEQLADISRAIRDQTDIRLRIPQLRQYANTLKGPDNNRRRFPSSADVPVTPPSWSRPGDNYITSGNNDLLSIMRQLRGFSSLSSPSEFPQSLIPPEIPPVTMPQTRRPDLQEYTSAATRRSQREDMIARRMQEALNTDRTREAMESSPAIREYMERLAARRMRAFGNAGNTYNSLQSRRRIRNRREEE